MIAPLGHVGHWALDLLYVAPLAVVVGVLGYQALKDRRAAGRDGAPARRPPAQDEG